MFEFHPCDRCQYSEARSTFCKKHFNQFKTNERYLTAASKSKVIDVLALCFKFKYQKESVITFKDLFEKSHSVQLSLF